MWSRQDDQLRLQYQGHRGRRRQRLLRGRGQRRRCYDGTFAARQSDGALIWRNDCLAATQAVEPIGSFPYKGSHAHNCSFNGGFQETGANLSRHLLAQRISDGTLGPWYPNTNG